MKTIDQDRKGVENVSNTEYTKETEVVWLRVGDESFLFLFLLNNRKSNLPDLPFELGSVEKEPEGINNQFNEDEQLRVLILEERG